MSPLRVVAPSSASNLWPLGYVFLDVAERQSLVLSSRGRVRGALQWLTGFISLEPQAMEERLRFIAAAEGLEYGDDVYNKVPSLPSPE